MNYIPPGIQEEDLCNKSYKCRAMTVSCVNYNKKIYWSLFHVCKWKNKLLLQVQVKQ